jgi:hypothetical protein
MKKGERFPGDARAGGALLQNAATLAVDAGSRIVRSGSAFCRCRPVCSTCWRRSYYQSRQISPMVAWIVIAQCISTLVGVTFSAMFYFITGTCVIKLNFIINDIKVLDFLNNNGIRFITKNNGKRMFC